jgi:serine/threonine-protein kinase RsbW
MSEHSLLLTSPPGNVDDVHDMLASFWASEPSVTDADRMAFETAIIELAANVIQHADDGAGVTWRLTVSCSPEVLVAKLVDDGVQTDLVDGGRALPDALAESGRGLAFVEMLVDDIDRTSSPAGNELSISKRRSHAHD